MDDFYFSDKKSRNDKKTSSSSSERFSQSDYYDDTNSYKPKNKPFTVNIPEDKLDYTSSRTPKGQKVSSAPLSRTPQGQRMSDISKDIPEQNITRQPAPKPNTPKPPVQKSPAPSRQASAVKSEMPVKRNIPKKKRSGAGKKVFLALLLILVLCLGGAFMYGWSILGEINYEGGVSQNAYVDESTLFNKSGVTNILVLGSDARSEGEDEEVEGQRADTMILFSIDKKNKQLKLTSFLRDTYVYIPDAEYYDKLNAAFSLGGPQLTMDTLEYNFGVNIDQYVIIDFNVFKQLVDLIGGVPVEISEYEAEYMVNELHFTYIKEGVNNLNGNAGLWYCRMRYLDDDFNRTERQRKFIKAFIGKVTKTNPLTLVNIVKEVLPNISTSISQGELVKIGLSTALSILSYDIVQQQIPAEGTWKYDDIDGASVIAVDEEMNAEILKNFLSVKYDPANAYTLPEGYEPVIDYYEDDYRYEDDYYNDRQRDDYYYDDYGY